MKVDLLDTHDRYEHFTSQSFDINECCVDLIRQEPFGPHAFYIFAHPRTEEDGVSKRFIWQPRLLKPKAQTNSYLFKVYPPKEDINIIWMLPPREMWNSYKKGKVTESEVVLECINFFENDRETLERPLDDDPSPKRAQEILFDYQPQLFRRDTLPPELKGIWDRKMAQRAKPHSSVAYLGLNPSSDDSLQ